MEKSMKGWKTKTGAIIGAIGVTITGASEMVPIPEISPWLKFAGFLLTGIGGALATWGIGHKIEKNNLK